MQVVYNALNPSAGGPMPKGAPGQDYGRLLERAKANDMGTIIIRALAGGALSGTIERHPLAMQVVDPIGSAPDFAADVARTKALEPLVREGGAANLTEFAERFVISHPAVSTMLVGYSTLDHLEAAIAAVNKGPLPESIAKRLSSIRWVGRTLQSGNKCPKPLCSSASDDLPTPGNNGIGGNLAVRFLRGKLRSAHRRRDGAERAVQAVAIDADAFHDALHVVAGLAERDHLDPVDHVDLAGARIADRLEPARHAVGPGIVGGSRELVGAAEALQHLGEILACRG